MLEIKYEYGGFLACNEVTIDGNNIVADGYRYVRTDEISTIESIPDEGDTYIPNDYFDDMLTTMDYLIKHANSAEEKQYAYGFYDGIKEFFNMRKDYDISEYGKELEEKYKWFKANDWRRR